MGEGPPDPRGARADGGEVEADRRHALPDRVPGVLQASRPGGSEVRPGVRCDRGGRRRGGRGRVRAGDRPRGPQEEPQGAGRGPEEVRLVPRHPPLWERPARGVRDGRGAADPVDLQARAHPGRDPVPEDARAVLPLTYWQACGGWIVIVVNPRLVTVYASWTGHVFDPTVTGVVKVD